MLKLLDIGTKQWFTECVIVSMAHVFCLLISITRAEDCYLRMSRSPERKDSTKAKKEDIKQAL